jgi:hypothetical protein
MSWRGTIRVEKSEIIYIINVFSILSTFYVSLFSRMPAKTLGILG